MVELFNLRRIIPNVLVVILAVLSVLLPFMAFETEMNAQGFPESYKPYLRQLHAKYPKWDFVAYHTGLDWNEVIEGESALGRNLVQNYHAAVPSSWKSIEEGAFDWVNNDWIPYSGDEYVQASIDILQYYMDPRNFLNEENVFQFELLSYSDSQTVSGVDAILKNSFMYKTEAADGITYSEAFKEIGQKFNISPYLLANRALQEQSHQGQSELISGNYPGYEGYYNYFNIAASGATRREVIENGLTRAKEEGWDTIYKSLEGGAAFLAENYINQGQDTLYLQKFDVESEHDGLYWHQYMQALYGAYNEGNTAGRAYEELRIKDDNFTFKIPVYENMQESACEKPTGDGNPNYKLKSLSVKDYPLTPEFNPDILEYTVTLPEGLDSVVISAKAFAPQTGYKGIGKKSLSKGEDQLIVLVKAENGVTVEYKINLIFK